MWCYWEVEETLQEELSEKSSGHQRQSFREKAGPSLSFSFSLSRLVHEVNGFALPYDPVVMLGFSRGLQQQCASWIDIIRTMSSKNSLSLKKKQFSQVFVTIRER